MLDGFGYVLARLVHNDILIEISVVVSLKKIVVKIQVLG